MSRATNIEAGSPVDNLIAAMWRGILDDLQLNGYVNGDLPPGTKKRNFQEAARIRRSEYREAALAYLDSTDFRMWAIACEFEPDELRRKLLNASSDC